MTDTSPKDRLRNLLRWSERYTKTDMLYVARGGFWLSAGQIITSAGTFILALAFANWLPKETYGTYKYILALAGILAASALPSMGTAVTRAVALGKSGSYFPALIARIQWGGWGMALGVLAAGYYFFHGNTTLSWSLAIAAAAVPFFDPLSQYDDFLAGKREFALSTRYTIGAKVFTTAALIGAVFLTQSVPVIVLVYFISWIAARAYCFWLTAPLVPKNEPADPDTLAYGKHLSLMGVVGTIANYLDGLLIFQLLGPAQLAVFTLALAPTEQIKSLLKSAGTLALPKLADKPVETVKSVITRPMLAFAAVIAAGVVVYILAAPFLFSIFFPKYLDSLPYTQLLAISLIAACAQLPIAGLQALSATRALYILNVSGSLVQIGTLIVFTALWGILGAVISRIVFRFYNLAAGWILLRRQK